MPVSAPIAGDSLARGLRTEFRNTWLNKMRGVEGSLGRVMQLGIQSDKIEELYGYWEPPMHPRRLNWGESQEAKPWRARNFAVENLRWGAGVEWFNWQKRFDQLRDLEKSARKAGTNFALLPLRVFIQIISATTDADLLEVIPNAPDGVPLFSAVDGDGADRFEITGGNIQGGSGLATSDAIREDLFDGLERLKSFKDPEGQEIDDPDIVDMNVDIWYALENEKVFREAFVQGRTLDGGAAVTNVILDSGLTLNLRSSAKLSGEDWFIFRAQFDPAPIFEQVAMPLEEHFENASNSDRARRNGLEALFWETFRGYGVNLPLGAVKIDN